MLYAAHLGWLSSTIKYKAGKKEETTSKAEYYSGGMICNVPDIGDCAYLAMLWDEAGRCQSNGMGVSAISWGELNSHAEVAGTAKWERQLLHAMSRIFVDARAMFSDLVCEPPYLYGDIPFGLLSSEAAGLRRKR